MNLNREPLTHIEELQQQRESGKAPGKFSQQLLRRLLHQLPDGFAFERAIGNYAGMVVAIAQQPRFADRAIAGEWSREQASKTSSTPESILVNWLEPEWI
jgi:hypothetical protein